MKNTIFTLRCLDIFLLGVFCLSGCDKDSDARQGYTHTDAIHNTLTQSVLLVNGYGGVTPGGKDTSVFSSDTIKIQADSTYLNTYFVCTKNCQNVYDEMGVAPPGLMKFIIGDKVKIDTACGFAVTRNPYKPYDCTVNAKNYFNENSWKDTRDNDSNVLRREYTIDQSDLDKAK